MHFQKRSLASVFILSRTSHTSSSIIFTVEISISLCCWLYMYLHEFVVLVVFSQLKTQVSSDAALKFLSHAINTSKDHKIL